MPGLLLRFDDLKSLGIGLSRDSIRRLAAQGKFPQPRRLGGHHIVFIEAEVQAWVADLPEAAATTRSARPERRGR
jgi:predicted DNA-binding transcriptional regulator AlpA